MAIITSINNLKLQNINQLPNINLGNIIYGKDLNHEVQTDFIFKVGYICTNSDEVEQVKNTNSDQKTLFDSWTRISNKTGDYTDSALPSELDTWEYVSGDDIIRNTTNSVELVGLISPKSYSNYIWDLTLRSSDSDDDCIGIILAFNYDSDGTSNHLTIGRTGSSNVIYGLYYNTYHNDGGKLLVNNTSSVTFMNGNYGSSMSDAGYTTNKPWDDTGKQGWNYFYPNGVHLRVERIGSLFKIWSSNWGSTEITDNSLIQFDVASDNDTLKFNQPCRIGYFSRSQRYSEWCDIKFVDLDSIIYDISNGNSYIPNSNGDYDLSTERSIYTDFGIGRFVYNDITNKLFFLNNNSVTIVGN